VEVDHKNLTILRDSENAKVRRWKNFLQRFDIVKWHYIKGETNTVADALSRVVEIADVNYSKIKEIEFLGFLIDEVDKEFTQSDEENNDASRPNPGKGAHEIGISSKEYSIMEETKWADSSLFNLEEERKLHIDPEHKRILHKVLEKVHCATEGHLGVAKTLVLVQAYLK